jgi:hypothetical protein
MRVPPDAVTPSRGNPAAVARSIAATMRSAARTPIDPARKAKSPAITAIRCPPIRASPVRTDSSWPLRAAAAASTSR